jgi:integrase/recombinase XerD
VVVLDFSGKRDQTMLAASFEAFLSEIAQIERLRPHTVRAYRYELAAAAADARFRGSLDDVRAEDLDAWLVRPPAASSTVGRPVATFRRFIAWAARHQLCVRNPLLERAPLRGRRRLPRPIREQHEQRALDAAIGSAQQPYRLIFTLLRETGMRVGEVLDLRWGDVTLEAGREALRVREAKNGLEVAVPLQPRYTRLIRRAALSMGQAVRRRRVA